jgi:hypothetical protein
MVSMVEAARSLDRRDETPRAANDDTKGPERSGEQQARDRFEGLIRKVEAVLGRIKVPEKIKEVWNKFTAKRAEADTKLDTKLAAPAQAEDGAESWIQKGHRVYLQFAAAREERQQRPLQAALEQQKEHLRLRAQNTELQAEIATLRAEKKQNETQGQISSIEEQMKALQQQRDALQRGMQIQAALDKTGVAALRSQAQQYRTRAEEEKVPLGKAQAKLLELQQRKSATA